MSEIRTIPEKILASGIQNTSINTIGSFSKKVIHHNAGAPTAADDTGLGYVVGSIWVDTSSGDMYTATVVAAENATWINQAGSNVNQFTIYGTVQAFNYGGWSPLKDTIERWSYSSPAAAADAGELTTARRNCGIGQMKDRSYGYVAAGMIQGPNVIYNQIGRFPFAATYDEADVGEFVIGKQFVAKATDGTYGWVGGGNIDPQNPGPPGYATDSIEKLTLASPTPAADIGEVANEANANDDVGMICV